MKKDESNVKFLTNFNSYPILKVLLENTFAIYIQMKFL